MKIIYEVLEELRYFANEEFEVTYQCLDENKKLCVYPFISEENVSQVFLVLKLKDEDLKDVVDGTLVKEIAVQFRRKIYHRAEMDRNTTLLIISEYVNGGEISKDEKVKIEDDPYYFKKYVFSYNEIERKNAEIWIEKDENNNRLIEKIQNYITDTKKFGRYKADNKNEPIYAYFVELITKIPIFPMKKVETKGIKTIEQYLDEEIDKFANLKKPLEINKVVLESFLQLNLDEIDVKNICNEWKRLLKE